MFKKVWQKRLVWGKVLIVGLTVLAIVASVYSGTAAGRVSDQETLVLGQTEFAPGAPAALRVVVRDFKTTQPVANATVWLSRCGPKPAGRCSRSTKDELTPPAPRKFSSPCRKGWTPSRR